MASQKVLRSFGTPAEYTITLASLASSVDGKTVNHGAMTASTAHKLRIFVKVKTASITAPDPITGANKIFIWGYTSDGTRLTDGIAATAATGVVVKMAQLIGTIDVPKTETAAALTLSKWFTWEGPGAFWAIGIGHNTGGILSATAGDHAVFTQTDNPDIQASA